MKHPGLMRIIDNLTEQNKRYKVALRLAKLALETSDAYAEALYRGDTASDDLAIEDREARQAFQKAMEGWK